MTLKKRTTAIKMCGLSRPEDIYVANAIKPDYVGFVFARGSRRQVTVNQAAELRQLLDSSIQTVGVFVNEEIDEVAKLLRNNIIDMAQLHGQEDNEYIRHLRNMCRKPVIQAFRIHTEADLQRAMESSADYLLLDGGAGDGKTFDWELLCTAGTPLQDKPVFLAGGLNPDNVAEAIGIVKPYGVDVSSGIEHIGADGKATGRKNPAAMHRFARVVRETDAAVINTENI